MYDSMGRWGERGTAEESQCAEESAQRVVRVTCHAARRHTAHARALRARFLIGSLWCVCVTHTVRSCDCCDFMLLYKVLNLLMYVAHDTDTETDRTHTHDALHKRDKK